VSPVNTYQVISVETEHHNASMTVHPAVPTKTHIHNPLAVAATEEPEDLVTVDLQLARVVLQQGLLTLPKTEPSQP
jgi:hypothetical protein